MGVVKEKSLVSTIDSGATYLSFMYSFNSPVPRRLLTACSMEIERLHFMMWMT